MISTVTTTSTAAVSAAVANPGLATALGVVTAACFVLLLITREMASAAGGGWLVSLRRGVNIALYPLGLAFVLIMWNQLALLLS